MKLENKVAVITGGAQGIGAAFALGFAKEGAKIVIADIMDGKDAVKAVEKAGSEAIYVKTDVTSQEACDALAKATVDRFGSIDILVNNAAIFGDVVMKPFTELTDEEWDRLMAVNVKGPFHCCKSVFPYMKEKGGKIINMSSASFLEGVPFMPHYVASKGAIMAFTRAMARELGDHKINVNAIAPGYIQTQMTDEMSEAAREAFLSAVPLKRVGTPDDVASAVLFLALPESDYITGQVLQVDGGMLM